MSIGQQVAEQVTRINNEVNEQATILSEISELLQGRTMPSELCTVTLNTSGVDVSLDCNLIYLTIENGEMVLKDVYLPVARVLQETHSQILCLRNTEIILGQHTMTLIDHKNYAKDFTASGEVELIPHQLAYTLGCRFKVTGDGSITWGTGGSN